MSVLAHGPHGAGAPGWALPALVIGFGVAVYLVGVARFEQRRPRRWSKWRTGSFVVGCLLIAVAVSPPAEEAAETATGHMVQHLLLGMYAPLALVLAAPMTLMLGGLDPVHTRAFRRLATGKFAGAATNLVVVSSLNAGGLFLLYLTPLYALSIRSEVVHQLVHLHFLVAGFLFMWVVAGLDPIRHRPPLGQRLAALVVVAGAHAFLAKFLYSRAGRLPPSAQVPAAELERAAQWMYWGGHLAELALLVVAFASWYRSGVRQAGASMSRASTGVAVSSAAGLGVGPQQRAGIP